ncbi:pyrroline-5-carboxylate reductase [Acidipropionibacterium jensenii]|uniref:pyrroline-5-carboxylate reductase n=1 Tax=Acidipropionibacterium jensenii TaxID=1749 RepID=UPI000BC32729|nr:pyrroline-5-carboxylate reductase [Acidipropionibacterium jensenii]AZZ42939.1 pyrroline-5-carboxylate reductase [Acidipropionibacterium jensenii]
MNSRLGIIGFGQMGGAIGSGLVANGALDVGRIMAWDLYAAALQHATDVGIGTAGSVDELCSGSDIVLLSVKPQDAPTVLEEAGAGLAGKAVVSIVAGWDVETLSAHLPESARVLRVMPNTPARVAAGAFGLSESTTVTDAERSEIEEWFSAIGLVEWVPERLMDAVTGLSGGIPAYAAIIVDALADGGVQQGLKRPVARRLVLQSLLGSAQLMLETDLGPGDLKDAVCSPAGTTIEGVRAIERAGVRSGLIEAVIAASQRAAELK